MILKKGVRRVARDTPDSTHTRKDGGERSCHMKKPSVYSITGKYASVKRKGGDF